MYCSACGNAVQASQRFCSVCGHAVAHDAATPAPVMAAANVAPPPSAEAAPVRGSAPQSSPVAKHRQILGILWIVVSLLRLVPAVGMMFFGHLGMPFLPGMMRGFLSPIIGAVGAFFAITAVVGLVAGWGLLDRQPWARMLAIVLGCVKLLDFPLGTALGIYTLWVLASPGSDTDYQRVARAR